MKHLALLTACGVCLLSASSAVGAVAPSGLTPNGTTVSLHTDEQKAFLGLSRQERRDVYTDRSYRTTLAGDRSGAPKPVTLSWSGDGPATVAVSRSAGGKPVFVATVTGGTVAVSNLEMNASYVWTVANAVGSAVGRFSTEDLAPRLLRDPNPARYADEDVGGALVALVHGVRDLGGRLGLDGRRVRQGRIIRTSQFNDASGSFINDTNRGFWRDELGVRTDLDLRKSAELAGITASPLGTDVKFVNCAIGRYENFFDKSSTNAFRKAFAVLLDEANYPVAVHCLDGQDRTGIFAFLVNALLDVDEDELLKDWEATAFWNSAGFFQHDGLIDTFLAGLAVKFPGETVQDQAFAFIRSLGFTAAQITAFRELMLEPAGSAPAPAEVSIWTGLGADSKWSTAGNWTVAPASQRDVYFPAGCSARVMATMRGSDTWRPGALTVGEGATVIFDHDNSNTKHHSETAFNSTHGFTLVQKNGTLVSTLTRGDYQQIACAVPNGGTESIVIESGATLISENGKLKVGEIDYRRLGGNVTFISRNDTTGNYMTLNANASLGNVELPASATGLKFLADSAMLYCSSSPSVTIDHDAFEVSFTAKNGGRMETSCFALTRGVPTISAEGGSTIALKKLVCGTAGADITVGENCRLQLGEDFSIGAQAGTLALCGADPQVVSLDDGHALTIGANATVRLAPTLGWSAKVGRIEWPYKGSRVTVDAGVKYEIDVSGVSSLSAPQTFCLVSATNKTNMMRSYGLPADANVALTGEGAAGMTATFSKDATSLYLTIAPKPVDPGDPFAPGDVGGANAYRYAKAGVTYQVIHFTDTAAAKSWTVPAGVRTVDLLVVGGGGAGGGIFKADNDVGTGGGGAGGLVHKAGLEVTPGSVFTFKVGAGGAATTSKSSNGEPSWASNSVWSVGYLAGGGGAGGSYSSAGVPEAGKDGANGGGGCGEGKSGGAAIGSGAGHAGGIGHYARWSGKNYPGGAGGGGADLCGTSAGTSCGGNGGLGKFCDITGTMLCYAGGGAGRGGTDNEKSGASGTCDAGGANAPGTDGLGGGGGGLGAYKSIKAGYRGGSGTVVVRYVVSMEPAAKPTNLSPNGTTLDLHNETQLKFFRMSTAERTVEFTSGDRGTLSKAGDCLPKPIPFSWTGGGTNTLRICRADGSVFLERTVVGTATEVDGFEVGADYTWTVANENGTSEMAAFSTSTQVPRLLRDPRFVGATLATRKIGSGIVNIREPGGMVGLGGRRVKPNLLFRSAALNRSYASATNPNCLDPGETYVNNEAETNFWLKTLKIKTEVDLRDPDEYGVNATVSALGPSVGYVTFPVNIGDGQHCPCYEACFTADGKKKVKRVLDVVMNPANYPLIYHCSGGQDRTGSLAFVLEGLLGVDEDTLILDWECLALYSNSQSYPTIAGQFEPFLAGLNAYPGETINDRIVAFVKDTGVTDEQIETFRAAMLEGGSKPETPGVWFDGAVGGKARGGSWTTPLPDRVELTDARYVLAGPDEPFAFTATEAKEANAGTNLIVRTVLRFGEPATDGFPEVQPDQKMAATVCTFGGEARYCVLARDSEASPATNRWVDTGLAATTDKDVALAVTIVKNAQGVTTAEYGFDGEAYGPVEVVAEGEISRFSYSGTGEVVALAGQWNELAPISGPTVDGEPVDPAEVFAMARSNKPIEYPSAPELTGEVGAQTIAFGGVSVNVPRYYTATLSDNTVTLALNDFARPIFEDSDDDKKAIAVGETTVSLHVGNVIEGFFYRVVTTPALRGEWTPVTAFLPVGDFTVNRKATDESAFYKIEVSDVGESVP